MLFLDMAKGFLPVYIATLRAGDIAQVYIIALMVVIGHDFSPFLRFKGGKGVAASLGVFIVLAPIPTLVIAVIFFLVTSIFKFVSFGSVMASFSYPVVAYILGYTKYLELAVVLGGLIIIRHWSNLKRLWHGREKKI